MRANVEPEDAGTGREAALRRVLDDHLAAAAGGGGEPESAGLALLDRERWAEAAEVLADALRQAERDGAPPAVLAARLNLARALTRTGDLDRAIELLGPLPDGFAALPEPDDGARARALASLGEAYLRADRPVAAINFFGQALEILRRLDAVDGQAAMFTCIAEAARLRGDGPAERAARARAAELSPGA
ncbi:tetratricopeptide repeat protein [Actinomadura darangshiensis]|uniref:Tetratricopeptide repeat protein n=1 Tax=Actinomadura darangshiensis TaxID=705336 RepID=A0A4R5BFU1_9ACTN|nr:tetratricopeptide repeat protein [Actinomadura darangshiensis]TDD85241.1 tetratricopeptide repeat protein [Actinomadura darangshiensis]